MTKVVGITGGIGSGKTTLSKHLKNIGYSVHESDNVVSSMYKKPNRNFIEFIKKIGLKETIKKDKINKKLIANQIFNNTKLKLKLEKFIHKKVKQEREAFIKKNKQIKKKLIFIDVPLLFENRLEKQFDLVLCVIASKKNRVKRVLKKKKFSKEILKEIIRNQTTDKERRRRANFIIYNNKTKKDFIFSLERVLMNILI